MALSGRGTSSPKLTPGNSEQGVRRQQVGMRFTSYVAISSVGVSWLDQLKSCSAADCARRNRKPALLYSSHR